MERNIETEIKRAFETCLEMIEQRGYIVLDHDDDRILADKPDGTQMCIFIATATKFNVESIQELITMMHNMSIKHSIIVYKDTATPVAKKIIEETKDMDIELFHIDELQYNLTKHYLVPRHELAHKKGTKEYVEFKKKFNADKFPILLSSDPVVRFYHYQKGDIIRVYRSNGFISYRIVK